MTDDAREARRILRRLLHKLWKMFVLGEPVPEEDDGRASGNVVCEACGETYYRHPEDPREPWMTLLCGGRRVKL